MYVILDSTIDLMIIVLIDLQTQQFFNQKEKGISSLSPSLPQNPIIF